MPVHHPDQDALIHGYDPAVGVANMNQLNTRVRSKGMLFTSYYLAFPLCSPCRSTVLSGRMPHNHGFVDNGSLNSSLYHPVQEAQSLPVWLEKAGYQVPLIISTMLPGTVQSCTYALIHRYTTTHHHHHCRPCYLEST
jgi:arylsulfatase A-like enzyme